MGIDNVVSHYFNFTPLAYESSLKNRQKPQLTFEKKLTKY